MPNTTRLTIPYPQASDPANVPSDMAALANRLDTVAAWDDQGTFAGRPAAGVRGKYYFATDTATLYRDTGTAWVAFASVSILQDVIANRPAASAAGRFFWATDESVLYRDDGSAWYTVGSFVGEIRMFVGASGIPTGWLACDGSLIATATYPRLFAILGHSANGGTDPGGGNFKLPDLRDKVPVGVSGTRARGTTGGEETHLLTGAESGMPAHTHPASTSGQDSPDHSHTGYTDSIGAHNHGFVLTVQGINVAAGGYEVDKRFGSGVQYYTDTQGQHQHAVQTYGASARHTHTTSTPSQPAQNAGSAHNNMQPYQAWTYIIKAK